mgnify:CR=1 FL=1
MGSAGEDHEDDRLSWLEKAETAERDENGSGLGGVLVLVGIGLALIAAAIFGWWWLHSSHGAAGSGDLIQAQPGPYKVKPGDTVIYSKYAGTEIAVEAEDLLVMGSNDILAILS